MIPYLAAGAGFSSTLSFTILTLPFIVPASSSSAGAIILQGPHHSAQKSTTTGSALFSTCASKSASETFETPMGHLVIGKLFGLRAERPLDEPQRMEGRGGRQGAITPECFGCLNLPQVLTVRGRAAGREARSAPGQQ